MVPFTITPLTDHTGAEVIGLDFTEPIDIETRATLNRAFAERTDGIHRRLAGHGRAGADR
jgi:alpha-ketoglutarate-dependent taurine dioxygenase